MASPLRIAWLLARRHAVLVAGVFLLFAAGFLLFYGREAVHSGSWRYVISHDDEYLHWAMARAVGQEPRSDGNAFSFEERGRSNPFLTNATIVTVGLVADGLGIPAIAFFPLWKVIVPFLAWLAFWLGLTRWWRKPPLPSAAVALLVLLITLFLHGSAQFTLFRFPRPGDALWLAILWACLALAPGPMTGRRLAVLIPVALATLVLTPYYALLGVWLLAFRGVWEWWLEGGREVAIGYARPLLALAVLAALQLWYLRGLIERNRWLALTLGSTGEANRQPEWIPLLVFAVVVAMVLAARRIGGAPLSSTDRALLALMAIEPILANTRVVLGTDHQMSSHRYYFLTLQLTAIVGWLVEKLPGLRARGSRGVGWAIIASLATVGVAVIAYPETNWLCHLPNDQPSNYIVDNSVQMASLFPWLVLVIWGVTRSFDGTRALHRIGAVAAIALVAAAGFGLRPSQMSEQNRDYPFDGAYTWMREHAQPWEVVLTLPPNRILVDYLAIHTDLKPYVSILGRRFTSDSDADELRLQSYFALWRDVVDRGRDGGPVALDGSFGRLRLDYVLVETGGEPEISIGRLDDSLVEVFRDERAMLLRIERGVER